MGGWTEAKFVGDDAKKVFEHLHALKADVGLGEQKNPAFNTYFKGFESDDNEYEWSVRGSNHMNGLLLDGLRAAIEAVGATGRFTSQGDCFPIANDNYENGQKVVESKGPWQRLDMEARYISEENLPYRSGAVGLSNDFEPADGTTADEVADWVRENRCLSADGEGTNFISLCKDLSAMIKTGTVNVCDIQCEDESRNMDVMVKAKNEVMWRSWDGEGESGEEEDDEEEGEEEEEEKEEESDVVDDVEEAAEAAAEDKEEEEEEEVVAVARGNKVRPSPAAPVRKSKRLKAKAGS